MNHPHVTSHPRKAPDPILAAPLLRQRQIERDRYPAFLSTRPLDQHGKPEPAAQPKRTSAHRGLTLAAAAVFGLLHVLSHLFAVPTEE